MPRAIPLVAVLAAAVAALAAVAHGQSCASSGCRFVRDQSCQCDQACAVNNDCCSDYTAVCKGGQGSSHGGSASIDLAPTCDRKGCGRPGFNHADSCQCDSYCRIHNDCCADYDDVCSEAPVVCPSVSCVCLTGFIPEWSLDEIGCPSCACVSSTDGGNIAEVSDNSNSNAETTKSTLSVPLIAGVAAGVVLVAIVALVAVRRLRGQQAADSITSSGNSSGSSELTWDDFDVVGSEASSQSGGSSSSLAAPRVIDPDAVLGATDFEMLNSQYLELERERSSTEFWTLEPDTCHTYALNDKANAFNSSQA